jgi:hypothetical protein
MLLTTIAHNLNPINFFSNRASERWYPPILDVETVEPGDYVYILGLDLIAEVEGILPDPFAISEYDAEPTAFVTFYDPDIESSRSDYLYEGECYVVDRMAH